MIEKNSHNAERDTNNGKLITNNGKKPLRLREIHFIIAFRKIKS